MTEALQLAESTPRPKGVTKRQMRLAALLPRCETAAEALRQAGYSASTIRNNGYRQVALGGVKRATGALQARQADSARGFMALSGAALAKAAEDVAELEPRDRLALAIKAAETAHALGEHVQQEGDASAWKRRLLRMFTLAVKLTEMRLDPTRCSGFAARNRAARKKARGY